MLGLHIVCEIPETLLFFIPDKPNWSVLVMLNSIKQKLHYSFMHLQKLPGKVTKEIHSEGTVLLKGQ